MKLWELTQPQPADGKATLDIEDETDRLRAHILRCLSCTAMLDAIAGLRRVGFSEGAVSAAVGELSERLVASLIMGTVSRRQNRGSDLVSADGYKVEVKARIANAKNRSNRQFNFRRTSAAADLAYCVTWVLEDERPILDQAIRVRMGFLIQHGKQGDLSRYSARTTHAGLRRLLRHLRESNTFL